MQPEPEIDIINRAKKGDLKAFNILINQHKSHVYHFCLKLLVIQEEAEEVAQDVFIIVYKKLKGFKGKSKFTTWLYRICYNECISRLRKNKKFDKLSDIQEEDYQLTEIEKGYESLDNDYRKRVLDQSLETLDEESRMIILLFYFHEKSTGEIAEITGNSITNVKTKLHRARKSMLSYMEKKLKLTKSELLEK